MRSAIIKHEKGIHVRAAAMVVQKAHELQNKYNTTLFFKYKNQYNVPGTILMPLALLKIKKGDEIIISADGEKADAAVEEMIDFLESDFQMRNDDDINEVDNLIQYNTFTFDQIYNNIANGLIVIDENDIINIFNTSAERIMKVKAKDAIGKKIYDVIPNSRLHIVRQKKTPEIGCKQVIGESVIITNRTPIVIDGHVKGAIAVFEDISTIETMTDRLREMKELHQRLQLVLENVQDGICVVDREGYITYVNPAYLMILNEKETNLIGKNLKDISPNGVRIRALREGKRISDSICTKENGRKIVANVSPIIVDGEVTGVVSAIKSVDEVQILLEKLNQVTAKAEYLEQELHRTKTPYQFYEKFIGKSGKVLDALAIAQKAAKSTATVIIRGESGTGKELIAEGIHYCSDRANGPFIRINCAAIPSNLLESELFGHEKGSFTGAFKKKLGKFELANKGTLFLDEIGEMEKSMQAKLLRVLQTMEFERVGGEETIKVDVRVIAATNRDLEKMVLDGEFREDLYYRLNVIPILLPPLRERKEDIPILTEFFLNKVNNKLGKNVKGFTSEAQNALIAYRWPGNVRELENIIERVVTLADGTLIGIEDLPMYISDKAAENEENLLSSILNKEILTWDDYEKEIIRMALERYGSFNSAGKALGLTHKTVAAKARKYGICRNEEEE
ncbi:sigma 54-interacting transcriptional regulator [Fonticella tunisiensis]|uniref:HTH-type transcriptional regulatory protein TyrR n=1 Tax=Fonticella tunisiensis TaxID=1096341 RepID=A0A4R7KQ90_9CLOT|nr:sigma 54-interacting transcriptional regulator [Fonticella tunisiensis]TDT61281.1 phosphotransferase system HPr (HPr) family protein [Fonticella tunisiensis]